MRKRQTRREEEGEAATHEGPTENDRLLFHPSAYRRVKQLTSSDSSNSIQRAAQASHGPQIRDKKQVVGRLAGQRNQLSEGDDSASRSSSNPKEPPRPAGQPERLLILHTRSDGGTGRVGCTA